MPASIAFAMPPRDSDFLDVFPRLPREIVGELFHEERAAPRIGARNGAGFLLQEKLRVAGERAKNPSAAPALRRARLVCSDCVWPCVAAIASIAVRTTLFVECPAPVSDQPKSGNGCEARASAHPSGKRLHQLLPKATRGAHLGDFHEEVHAGSPRRTTAAPREAGRCRARSSIPARTYSTPSATCRRVPDPASRPASCM